MNEFETVASVSDFQEGVGQAFPVEGRMVAVFLRDGKFYAIDDLCPHMGASLAMGQLEELSVACPWHGWRFCLRDGACEDNPSTPVECYEVRVVDEQVQVRVPD